MPLELLLVLLAFLAGSIASIAGFGIGSLLTPFLTLQYGAKLAIAAVSISHFLGTALRLWKWRAFVDRKALVHFGILSAAGSLAGAFLHAFLTSLWMTFVLGGILVFAGVTGLFRLAEKVKLTESQAWIAGAVSGIFGGLVGNQGGIRSAAMLRFDLSKQAYIATATAIGILVDLARMPVYVWMEGSRLLQIGPVVFWMSLGTMAGTFAGASLLSRIPEKIFKQVVSGIVLLLGIFTLAQGFRHF